MNPPVDHSHDGVLFGSDPLPQGLEHDPLVFGTPALTIVLPKPGLTLQEEAEWCLVRDCGCWHHIKFNNSARIYGIPGLYDRLLDEALRCRPSILICRELTSQVTAQGGAVHELRVLDVGAGNGPVAEQLQQAGVRHIVGVDFLPEARKAAERDRPGVYGQYHVEDLEDLSEAGRQELASGDFNCMTCVTRLPGMGVSARAFIKAFDLLGEQSWVAFNVKEESVGNTEHSDWGRLIELADSEGVWEMVSRQQYPHRITTSGKPVHYVACIVRKRKSFSSDAGLQVAGR